MVPVGHCSLCMVYLSDGHIAVVNSAYSNGCNTHAWNEASLCMNLEWTINEVNENDAAGFARRLNSDLDYWIP